MAEYKIRKDIRFQKNLENLYLDTKIGFRLSLFRFGAGFGHGLKRFMQIF
jgi:hypothetical protein